MTDDMELVMAMIVTALVPVMVAVPAMAMATEHSDRASGAPDSNRDR